MQEAKTVKEMPRYKCHKVVHAIKIALIMYDSAKARVEGRETDGSALIVPVPGADSAEIQVSQHYIRKHDPQAGGYYVVYENGYESFSPAEVFEKGYTRI